MINTNNTFQSPDGGQPVRVWTRENLNLNHQTRDAFIKSIVPETESQGGFPAAQKASPGERQKTEAPEQSNIVSAGDFASSDNIIVTDENSSIRREFMDGKSTRSEAENVPSSLMMDENGNLSSAPKGVADSITPDLVSTSRYKTATVGTFNIEWLGGCPYKDKRGSVPERKDGDYKKIADVIKDSGASLLALQEVVTEEALFKVLNHLPDWGFILSKNQNQKVALIFDKNRVKYDANSVQCLDEMADPKTFRYGSLRPPLSVYVKIDNFDCNIVVVHQKSGFSRNSMGIREKQSKMMNTWIQDYLQKNQDKDLLIMGDFNDFNDSRSLDDISRGGILRYATDELRKGDYTNIPHKGIIDHIGYTTVEGGSGDELKQDTIRTMNERKYPGYQAWGSDHKPVLVDINTEKDND